MQYLLKEFFENLSYLISPPFCVACKDFIKRRTIFCQNCFDKIEPVVSTSIKLNQKYSIKIFAISDYKDPIRTLILNKISGNVLASKYIGQLIWQMTNLKNLEIDYFVPVPLHWTRFIKRGYNQSEVIASILAQEKGKSVINIVKRYKYTKYQSSLPHHLKIENVKGVFKLDLKDFEKYKEKHLVIVDDLLTSGSTIISVAKELIKLNPKSISAVVGCRVT